MDIKKSMEATKIRAAKRANDPSYSHELTEEQKKTMKEIHDTLEPYTYEALVLEDKRKTSQLKSQSEAFLDIRSRVRSHMEKNGITYEQVLDSIEKNDK